jgi:hypothetical protein
MRLRRQLVAVVLVIVAGASIGESLPAVVTASGCPSTPLTVGELRGLWSGEYSGFAGMTNPRGRACYGGADVHVIGLVAMPDGLGGTNASGIKPAWLTEWGLWLYGTSNAIATGDTNDSYTIATAPKLGDLNERYARRWVVVTAHFDDPRAKGCRGWGVEPPTKQESVRVCRGILVLSSISTTSAPDTATLSPPTDEAPEPSLPLLIAAGILGAVAFTARRRLRASDRSAG